MFSAVEKMLTDYAKTIGFDAAVVIAANSPGTFPFFQNWIQTGKHAGMNYLAKNVDARSHPNSVLSGVKSLVMLAAKYQTVLNSEQALQNAFFDENADGKIASYACGLDYHIWFRQRFALLREYHKKHFPQGKCRGVVDTAPLLERQFAADAGIGFVGKNTMLINPNWGSRFFLGVFLSTEDLPTNAAKLPNSVGCGDCRQCLDACPCGALEAPYTLNAEKCINYWTIESRDAIPGTIREKLGQNVFGCEICQNACPWNKPKESASGWISKTVFEQMSAEEFEQKFFQTPLFRTSLERILEVFNNDPN